MFLANPRAHNALTVSMMRQLAEAVLTLSSWPGAVLAIASEHGGSFCSGGHLTQVRESLVEPEAALAMSRCMTIVLDALLAMPFLSVAVLEGPAIGGGVELATAADLRVATADARIYAAQVRLGVASGWGGAARLVHHVGRSRALRMMARSESLSAEEAATWGFVDHVGTGDREALLQALLGPALEHPVASVRAVKQQIAEPEHGTEAFLTVWGGAAHRRSLGLDRP